MRTRRHVAALVAAGALALTGCESAPEPERAGKQRRAASPTPSNVGGPTPDMQAALGDPADAARRYTEALLGGDGATACDLLSENGFRMELAHPRFLQADGDTTCRGYVAAYARLMDLTNLDQLDIDATARRATVSTAVATVTVTMSKTKTSHEINLVAEGDQWKVDGFSGANFSIR